MNYNLCTFSINIASRPCESMARECFSATTWLQI